MYIINICTYYATRHMLNTIVMVGNKLFIMARQNALIDNIIL